jgi:hypothetical protein
MKAISTAQLQLMVPELYKHVGEEYLILNEKQKQIVGAIKVIAPPDIYTKSTKYEIVYKKKG